jgi:EAL domain-containing protein (putative c-di-GMP-specific phosphodiesterase class I)
MNRPKDFRELSCFECASGAALDFDFTMAFQPIVDVRSGEVFAQEALVRGPNDEPSEHIFQQVHAENRYRFDQSCRVKAIHLASRLGIRSLLSINFMPNAVYRPELCIRTTLAAAERYGFPVERIVFEITEGEKVEDHAHLRGIIECYRQQGFLTAIDDFGAGYSGLNLLAELQTDLLKLDIALVRNIDKDKSRRAIVKGVLQVCSELAIRVIAEGVETRDEYAVLRRLGVELFQGYYFAKPAFQRLVEVPLRW